MWAERELYMFGVGVLTRGGGRGGISEIASTGGEKKTKPEKCPENSNKLKNTYYGEN